MKLALVIVLAAACGGPRTTVAPAAPIDRIAIVAAERGPQGARLVALDETGDRQFELLEPPTEQVVRDTHPAISPDGQWLVFASSRGRPLAETSLWIAPLRANALPVPLTDGPSIDSHPVWTPDGNAIVFASTREGGDFDLYSVPVRAGRTAGAPVALTTRDGHEVTPAVARDGVIYYAAITPLPDGKVISHIEARAPDGTIAHVTDGPADASPSVSPDDRTLVFARPTDHAAGPDGELWTMRRDSTTATQLIDLPLTDESGPVWSHDGRYVFATSVLRGAAGNTVFSSVIVIDTRLQPLTARLLRDKAAIVARLTPALTRTPLDARALATDPEYLPELKRIMHSAIAQQKLDQSSP